MPAELPDILKAQLVFKVIIRDFSLSEAKGEK